MELVYMHDSKSCGATHVGSTPTSGTRPWIFSSRRSKADKIVSRKGEKRTLGASQDLLRVFQNKVNEKIQKVYRSCKDESSSLSSDTSE